MGDDKLPRKHPWSSLSTVKNFDKGNSTPATVPLNRSQRPSTSRQVVKVTSTSSLIIISLMQQICTFYEGDSVRGRQLWCVMCKEFVKLKLIDASYTEEEYEALRGGYQEVLYRMISVARQLSGSEGPVRAPGYVFAERSRYRRDFREICCIGSGGFGVVYKALHVVDNVEYAVKKIVARSDNMKTIVENLNEVKTLARLKHPNIVPYNSAWIEPGFSGTFLQSLPPSRSESYGSESPDRRIRNRRWRSRRNFRSTNNETSDSPGDAANSSDNDVDSSFASNTESKSLELYSRSRAEHLEDSNSDCVSFRSDSEDNRVEQRSRSTRSSKSTRSTRSRKSASNTGSSGSNDCDESDGNKKVAQYKSNYTSPCFTTTLYIQMALCEKTVKAFLDETTERISDPTLLTITKQIFCGLEYLHSQNKVHHDIKPGNIFILRSDPFHICLADFGLTCPLQREHHQPTNGTPLYAAPEQLLGKCDQKSDVYSVGVVLLELLVRAHTRMELCEHIVAVKTGEIPHNYFPNPRWGQLISRMVRDDPSARPTSGEILVDLREDKDLIITQLSDENRRKDEEIERLRNALRDLQQENLLLKSRRNVA